MKTIIIFFILVTAEAIPVSQNRPQEKYAFNKPVDLDCPGKPEVTKQDQITVNVTAKGSNETNEDLTHQDEKSMQLNKNGSSKGEEEVIKNAETGEKGYYTSLKLAKGEGYTGDIHEEKIYPETLDRDENGDNDLINGLKGSIYKAGNVTHNNNETTTRNVKEENVTNTNQIEVTSVQQENINKSRGNEDEGNGNTDKNEDGLIEKNPYKGDGNGDNQTKAPTGKNETKNVNGEDESWNDIDGGASGNGDDTYEENGSGDDEGEKAEEKNESTADNRDSGFPSNEAPDNGNDYDSDNSLSKASSDANEEDETGDNDDFLHGENTSKSDENHDNTVEVTMELTLPLKGGKSGLNEESGPIVINKIQEKVGFSIRIISLSLSSQLDGNIFFSKSFPPNQSKTAFSYFDLPCYSN
ncbi:dentin sialophosphoprotein [Monodelphis domestica]|uniref:dentin sialophosphoprotein n=1 Tax=Monodelphis domestica TaxID=13616 RepID=UPI0024E1D535|nr:dentin sialophosphoprotein [Monodelphis domestica]